MSLQEIVSSLQGEAGQEPGKRRLPPVHLWNPADCGGPAFYIRKDGVWVHEGVRMTRDSLVRLFATIMRKDEDGTTWLVTPGEKVRVFVEDAPFLAIRADRAPDGIVFTTNMGDVVVAGPENPIRVETDPDSREPRPYVLVRGRLEARILRAQFYDLVEWAYERDGQLRIMSQGVEFALGAPA